MKVINPLCHTCNKRTKSKGKNQGFECIKCKKHFQIKYLKKSQGKLIADFMCLVFSAHRHLARPIQRIGKLNNKIELMTREDGFISPSLSKQESKKLKLKSMLEN